MLANSLLIRTGIVAGLVAVAALGSYGVVSGVLPVQKLLAASKASTSLEPLPATALAAETSPSAELPATASVETVAAAAPQTVAPSLTSNDVVSKSFAVLPSKLQKPTPTSHTAQFRSGGVLGKRMVKSVAINPDGTPVDGPALAYANSGIGDDETPATLAAEQVSVGETPSVQPPTPAPAPKKIASTGPSGSSGKVIGGGVNVHVRAGKGTKVMFSLSGGTKVTVGQNTNGWLKITDPSGRTGWVYKSFVSRGT